MYENRSLLCNGLLHTAMIQLAISEAVQKEIQKKYIIMKTHPGRIY